MLLHGDVGLFYCGAVFHCLHICGVVLVCALGVAHCVKGVWHARGYWALRDVGSS